MKYANNIIFGSLVAIVIILGLIITIKLGYIG